MVNLQKLMDLVANAAILLVALMLAVLIVRNREGLFAREVSRHQAVGKVLAPPHGLAWASKGPSLVIAIQDGCRYCDASLPFYRNLAAEEKTSQSVQHLSIVMPSQASIEEVYLQRAALSSVPHASGVSLASIDVSSTPTLLLVDAQGKVRKEWIGQLS